MCSSQAFELHTLTGADVVVGVVMNGHVRVYGSRQDLYEAVSTACASSALSAEQTSPTAAAALQGTSAATVARPGSYAS